MIYSFLGPNHVVDIVCFASQDLAGADPAKDPLTCADNMKDDVEAWSANSVCHTDTNAVLKDQSLADIYWVLDELVSLWF